MTASMKTLQRVPCIQYLVQFLNNTEVYALLDFESEVNAITPIYTAKQGLIIQKTILNTQKIDGSTLKIYGMVIESFSI